MFERRYLLVLVVWLAGTPCVGAARQVTSGAVQSGTTTSNSEAQLTWDAVTIKPSDLGTSSGKYFRRAGRHLQAANVSLLDLISLAYSVHPKQVVNGPKWMDTAKYDIDGVPVLEDRPTMDQQRALYRSLLITRFHLVAHFESRQMPVYTLAVEKDGPKLTRTTREPQDGTGFSYTNQIVLTVRNASMKTFADGMQASFLDRPVLDRTGLTDRYDFTLKWTPEGSPARDSPDASPDLYTAIREQLGLKLVAEKANANALVIDRVDPPTAN